MNVRAQTETAEPRYIASTRTRGYNKKEQVVEVLARRPSSGESRPQYSCRGLLQAGGYIKKNEKKHASHPSEVGVGRLLEDLEGEKNGVTSRGAGNKKTARSDAAPISGNLHWRAAGTDERCEKL